MKQISDNQIESDQTILDQLDRLRQHSGSPQEFWTAFVKVGSSLVQAHTGLISVRDTDGDKWQTLVIWPPSGPTLIRRAEISALIRQVADGCATDEYAWDIKGKSHIFGSRIDLRDENRVGVAIFIGDGQFATDQEDLIFKIKLLSGIPQLYQMRREREQARHDVLGFVETLDLMVLLNSEHRYLAAAMTLCNEINSRFDCSRVSIGWLKKGYIRTQAISHMERFEKKMDAVQSLEAAMEEAFDQDEEIVIPKDNRHYSITKDHERFALSQGVLSVLSLPIRQGNEAMGVLTCEREETPFEEHEINVLRLICDQAAQRLSDLKKSDRWLGAKLLDATRRGLGKFFGVEHTFIKLMGILIFSLLAFMAIGHWDYRVEAPFILKTDDLAYIPSPFDGYIEDVHIQVGDKVDQNALLLTLDDRELLLEESSAIADRTRYTREAKKSSARDDLAEMRIAQALKVQTEARLDLIRYHLSNSELRSPFSGIVVEGELKELLGAPVRKGDVLFKVAKIEKMYALIDVDEKDIHELSLHQTGELAFVSRPELKFPIKVQLIEPVTITKEEGNVFQVRCEFSENIENWWRPGMSGIAKINIGKRNILWIFTHRTVNFFRLLLWW
jgi:HlyD family secretion protein/GAF domain-containing protein